jgi:pyruvate/2-oxoglutarate dehydrogenase complex dihydrolipoamide acyltransferase (E2) component
MPKMGDAMEEGTLLKWLKSEGDEVSEGDAIAEIETDKVTMELEAEDAGTLAQLIADEGAAKAAAERPRRRPKRAAKKKVAGRRQPRPKPQRKRRPRKPERRRRTAGPTDTSGPPPSSAGWPRRTTSTSPR